MTVGEMIEILQGVENKERLVILAKDGEGNNHSPLSDINSNAVYAADSTWSGEVGIERLTPELIKCGFSEENLGSGVPAVVLWPVN